ncbi:MAG TPA: hypothetical protein VLI54_00710 [Bacillota bacterium]|nr:hypothetical protein [Bacillota bacterium]
MKKHVFRLAGFLTGLATCLSVLVSHASAVGFTCTWTAGGSDDNFTTTANWTGCNGTAPTNGDNLVFNGSATSLLPINDQTNMTFGSLTFTGAAGFDITGNAFTLTGGIVDNGTGNTTNTIENNLTLSGNQSITGTHAPTGGNPLSIGIGGGSTLTIPSGTTVTVTSIGVNLGSALSGAGTLAFGGTTPSASITVAASNFTGAFNLGAGANINAGIDGALGSASVTIASGAVLYITSAQTNLTLSNAFTLAGTGVSSSGALNVTLASTGKLTLSGPVTLTADASVQPNGSAVVLTGTYTSNGHVLSATTGSLTLPAAAPAAPKTGLAAVQSNPVLVLAVASGAAILLGGLAYRLRSLPARK